MTQLWALTSKKGVVLLRYTDGPDIRPEDSGHRAECRNRNIWPLDREPREDLGELVDHETGAIVFSAYAAGAAIVPLIKQCAEQAILNVAPLWRQINDLNDPNGSGAAERRAQVAAIRQQSNDLEAELSSAESKETAISIRERALAIKGE